MAEALLEFGLDPNYEHPKFKEFPHPPRFPRILRFLPTSSVIFYKCLRPITELCYFDMSFDPCALARTMIKHGAVVNQVVCIILC